MSIEAFHKQLEALAPGFSAGVDHNVPKLIETKADGHYWTIQSDGQGGVAVVSRSGARKRIPEGQFGSLGKVIGNMTLMCESDYGSNRAQPRIKREGHPSVWIFDIRAPFTSEMNLIRRKEEIARFIADIPNDGFYELRSLEYQVLDHGTSPEEILGMMKQKVESGEEGLVIKYPLDSRLENETWLKRKKELEADFVCLGFEESEADWHAIDWKSRGFVGKPDKLVGAVVGGLYFQDGALKRAVSVGALNLELRIEASLNPGKFIGKVFTVKGFEWYRDESGAMRHPSFIGWRDDKPAVDCNLQQKPRLIL